MSKMIEAGDMVFLGEGMEGIGSVRSISERGLTIYIENGGEFRASLDAVASVHDGKVILSTKHLSRELLEAVGHAHDREDPDLVG